LTLADPGEDNTDMAVSRITKEDLTLQLEGDEAGRPALADVRRKYAWDHSTLKLPGAMRLDPKAPSTTGLAKDRDLVVYDSDPDEITGVEVAAALAAAGIRVHVLKGGLPEWVAASLPTETKDAVRAVPPPAPPAPAPAAPAAGPSTAKA
jgi:3-mercaptopyruvate sulfurtransferase SseA